MKLKEFGTEVNDEMAKSFNQKIIETENMVAKGRGMGRKRDSGKHIILDDDVAERFNTYCKDNFIIRRKILQKIVLDFLNKQDSQKG